MRGCYTLVLLVLCGCLSPGEYVAVTTYVIEPKIDIPKATPSDKTVGVRTLESTRPYRQQVVYRSQNMVLGYVRHVEWAELPAHVITNDLIDALTRTGRFADVGYAGDMNAPDYMLTGELRRFDMVETAEPWSAYIEVRLELRAALSPELIWGNTLSASEDLVKNDVSSLPAAMSKAVSRVIEQAVKEIIAK